MTEVAHDHQVCVKKFVTEELGVINSYDTWHGIFLIYLKNPFLIKRMHTIGTKNVVKKVKKVAEGKVKDEGKVWFKELRDKRMLFYTNLYKPFEISIIFSFVY